ncbi:MAG: ribonuclease HI family protein [Candidatus Brocadiales bacterium]
MRRTRISDQELLELIRKSIDPDSITSKDPRVTRKRLEELFRRLKAVIEAKPAKGKVSQPVSRGISERILVYIDGASRGNPGKAGIGVVIYDKKQQNVLKEICRYIGETTNNVAEYRALISGVEKALEYSPKELEILSDSELLVKQINGQYKVRAPSILPLYKKAKRLIGMLPKWKIQHIPREENALADALANMAIDAQSG